MLCRAIVVVMCVSLLTLWGCFDTEDSASPSGGNHADIDTVIDGVEVSCYFAENEITGQALASLLSRSDVQAAIEKLEALGYVLDPSASLVEHGRAEDGKEVTITILGFMDIENPREEAVYLMNFESEGVSAAVPFRYASSKELVGPGAVSVDGDLWAEVIFDPSGGLGPYSSAERWSWREYGKCTAGCMAAALIACGIGCGLSGPGFLHCLVVCTSGAAAACMLGCFFQVLW